MSVIPTFTVLYNLDSDTATNGNFILTADDVYTSQGIALSDVIGYYDIVFPDGTGYTGSFATPDFDGGTSLVTNDIPIPKDSFGYYMKGAYSFTLYVRVGGAVLAGDYTSATATFNNTTTFCAIPTNLDIDIVSDCFMRKIKATDNTTYTVFTIDTETLTLTPPANTGQSSYTVSGQELTYSFTHTGIYQVSGDVLLTYTSSIFTVNARVETATGQTVKCDYDLCSLNTCINTFYTNIQLKSKKYGGLNQYLQPNSVQWENYQLLPQLILRHDMALQCGQFGIADTLYQQIKTIVDCDCGCDDCGDDTTPKLVNPYGTGGGSNGTIYNITGNAPIVVTSTIVGDTENVVITLSSGFQTTVSTLVTDVAALEVDMTTTQADITTLQSDVATLQDDILDQVVADEAGTAIDNSNVYATVLSYTNAIGADNGTEWNGIADFSRTYLVTPPVTATAKYRLVIGGVTFIEFLKSTLDIYGNKIHITFKVQKISDTVVSCWARIEFTYGTGTIPYDIQALSNLGNVTVADMSTNTLAIQLQAAGSGNLLHSLVSGSIKKYTIV